MKQKLKYINLFEELSHSEIPYSKIDDDVYQLRVKFPESATSVPSVFNELTTEVINSIRIMNTKIKYIDTFHNLEHLYGVLWIRYNDELTGINLFNKVSKLDGGILIDYNDKLFSIEGFNNLKEVNGAISIWGNVSLNMIQGFDKLETLRDNLIILANPTLVTLSIPSTLIRSINYQKKYIRIDDDYTIHSPEEFVNSEFVIQDCIDKFNPGLHSDVVVTQIIENIETWGTDDTKERVYSHIAPYCTPEQLELLPDMYRYLHDPKYNNTGAKSVAKVATGITYGLF